MSKRPTPCPKCQETITVHSGLPIATCRNCGYVLRVGSPREDDPRRQRPKRPGEQKPL